MGERTDGLRLGSGVKRLDDTRPASPDDFHSDSIELRAAKINMPPLVGYRRFVKRAYECELRPANWYTMAKGIFDRQIAEEKSREHLTDEERRELDTYVESRTQSDPQPCTSIGKAPLMTELDRAVR